MNYFEIYSGGDKSGEIVIATRKTPDKNGFVFMNEEEFDNGFGSDVGRESRGKFNYYDGYNSVNLGGLYVLYPDGLETEAIRELKFKIYK